MCSQVGFLEKVSQGMRRKIEIFLIHFKSCCHDSSKDDGFTHGEEGENIHF